VVFRKVEGTMKPKLGQLKSRSVLNGESMFVLGRHMHNKRDQEVGGRGEQQRWKGEAKR